MTMANRWSVQRAGRQARTPPTRRRAPCKAARCRAGVAYCCRSRSTRTGEAHALRIEQWQQVDLPAIVEGLRAAQRRFGGGRSALQQLRRAAVRRPSATSVFSTSSSARTIAVLVMEDRFPLTALGDVVDRLRAARVEDGHREHRRTFVKRAAPSAMPFTRKSSATEQGAQKEPREPLRLRLLPARVGGVELRLRGEEVRPALQEIGRLSGLRGWNRRTRGGRNDARGVEMPGRQSAPRCGDGTTAASGFERRYRRARSRRVAFAHARRRTASRARRVDVR